MAWDSLFRTGKTAAKKAAKKQEARELERLGKIESGMSQIETLFSQKFNPGYFEGVRGAATDYAMKGVDDQYRDAQRNLMFAMARSSTGISSEAARRQGLLASDRGQALFDADSLGMNAEKQARSDVAREKSSIINQLQATADPGAAASASRSASEFLSINPAIDTLGPLFQNVTAGLAGSMRPSYDSYGQRVSRSSGSRGGVSQNRSRVIG